MCGITGIMTRKGEAPDESLLNGLADSLAHRGPDGRGVFVDGAVGLAQTRLAIIDLETGDQPLRATSPAGGAAALVANGEIYNYIELRAAMCDTAFATRSDCEPPLHLFLRDGTGFTDELRGMYAVAAYDPDSARLVVARDPFGIKPLYYAETDLGFIFASEPHALLDNGIVERRLRTGRRNELLHLQFTTGSRTAFDGIRRVLPGETLVVEAGRIAERSRKPALPADPVETIDEAEALRRLDAALVDSVTVHQRSDVPYAMFLSGGIDSSALLSLMARLNDRPVRAYTAGFPGADVHDERDHAATVAAAVGAEAVDVAVTEADFWAFLPAIAAAMDDPSADYAIVPTWLLARAARADGMKVVLSGEGGDELFAGYGRYRSAVRPWPFGRKMRRSGILDGLGVLREPVPRASWRAGIAKSEKAAAEAGYRGLRLQQAVDCADWLPHDLLAKLDRCLMAHGVEGRVPFLDPVVARAAFTLPDSLKVRGGLGKWALRRWLTRALPEARPMDPKRGFTVPVENWLAGRGTEVGMMVADQPGIAEICRPEAVRALFADCRGKAAKAAWTLLFYALWHRRHILGLSNEGNVFSCLSETN